jgi:hypothetical protein
MHTFTQRTLVTLGCVLNLGSSLAGGGTDASYVEAAGKRTLPAHCTIVGTVPGDEGFPLAHCADGSWLYKDMDGNGTRQKPRNVGVWRDASGYVMEGN